LGKYVAAKLKHSALDGRTTRHAGYGWIKTVAGQRKTRFRGVDRAG